jgi:crotonobetainyl-CoA:carnitine CoA-transferase CaiB-like acyl-CoA transferase
VNLPLHDVRVIAIEQYGAGPWGTLQLADLGAEVIKIEDPASRGDVSRYVPPFQEGEDSLFFESVNRNKKSISLDLRHAGGRGVLEDLVRHSDVLYSNLRGDQPDRLRVRYADLQDLNPRIVCCSLSGFGMTGPRATEGGYDYMMQGLAGWMSLTGPRRRAVSRSSTYPAAMYRRSPFSRAYGGLGATASAATAMSRSSRRRSASSCTSACGLRRTDTRLRGAETRRTP